MVTAVFGNHQGPINLLQNHHPGQVVGEGHGGHGKPPVGVLFDALRHPLGGADDEIQAAGPFQGVAADFGRKLFACEHLSLDAQGAGDPRSQEGGFDGVGLLFQLGGADLLLELDHFHFAQALEPLFEFVAGVLVEFFLEFTNTDQADIQQNRVISFRSSTQREHSLPESPWAAAL